jgi:hypothetical protein
VSPPTPDRAQQILLASGVAGGVEPARFEAWCEGHRGAQCTAWLDAELTLPLLAEAGATFADESVLADYARRVLSHYEHETHGAVATWRSGPRAGACLALVPVDVQALRAAATRHAVRLESLRPLWTGALALARRAHPVLQDSGGLLVVERCIVTVIEIAGGRISALQRHWLAQCDAAELDPLVRELGGAAGPLVALGHGLRGEPPARLQVIGSLAQEPATLLGQLASIRGALAPDFAAAPSPRLRPLGWALAGTGACMLALSATTAYDAYQTLDVEPAPAAVSAASGSPTMAATPARGTGEQEPEAATRAALAKLDYPWAQLFAASESAAPRGGAWLALEHRAAQPELRVSGLAPSVEEALAVAQRLGRAPGVADAFVARSEPRENGLVEFDVSVRPAIAGGRP